MGRKAVLAVLLAALLNAQRAEAQGGASDTLGALWSVALITALLLAVTLLMNIAQPKKQEIRRKTVVEVRCTSCEHREEREFSKGDYVGKIAGTCPKCGAHLVIDAIYNREEKPESKEAEKQKKT